MQDAAKNGVIKHPIYKPQKHKHTAHQGYNVLDLEVTVKCTLKGVIGNLVAKKEGRKLKLIFFKDGGESATKLDSMTIEDVRNALASPSKRITTNAGDIRNIRSDGLKRLVNPDK